MRSVLVVDDEPNLRRALQEFLSRKGYAVRVAADGFEGLSQLQAERPQFLVLDFDLPGMTGLEVLRHLHETASDVRVILMSGWLDAQMHVAALALGARACLSKPFSFHILRRLLDQEAEGEDAVVC